MLRSQASSSQDFPPSFPRAFPRASRWRLFPSLASRKATYRYSPMRRWTLRSRQPLRLSLPESAQTLFSPISILLAPRWDAMHTVVRSSVQPRRCRRKLPLSQSRSARPRFLRSDMRASSLSSRRRHLLTSALPTNTRVRYSRSALSTARCSPASIPLRQQVLLREQLFASRLREWLLRERSLSLPTNITVT